MTPVLDVLLQRLDDYSDRYHDHLNRNEIRLAHVHTDRYGTPNSSDRSTFVHRHITTYPDLLAHYEEDPRLLDERYWQ